MLVDSHCHLDFDDFEEDLDEIICRAKENGITTILNAGNNIDELDRQLELSEKYPFIYTAVGVHPHNASEYENITAQDFIAKAGHKKSSVLANAVWIIITTTLRETRRFASSENR